MAGKGRWRRIARPAGVALAAAILAGCATGAWYCERCRTKVYEHETHVEGHTINQAHLHIPLYPCQVRKHDRCKDILDQYPTGNRYQHPQ